MNQPVNPKLPKPVYSDKAPTGEAMADADAQKEAPEAPPEAPRYPEFRAEGWELGV